MEAKDRAKALLQRVLGKTGVTVTDRMVEETALAIDGAEREARLDVVRRVRFAGSFVPEKPTQELWAAMHETMWDVWNENIQKDDVKDGD